MSDAAEGLGRQHGERISINIGQEYGVCDWADRFGVTTDDLREALERIWPKASDVESWLKRALIEPKREA